MLQLGYVFVHFQHWSWNGSFGTYCNNLNWSVGTVLRKSFWMTWLGEGTLKTHDLSMLAKLPANEAIMFVSPTFTLWLPPKSGRFRTRDKLGEWGRRHCRRSQCWSWYKAVFNGARLEQCQGCMKLEKPSFYVLWCFSVDSLAIRGLSILSLSLLLVLLALVCVTLRYYIFVDVVLGWFRD